MGVGAGIVIDSAAADEYAECRLKARFSALDPGFALFETLYATREAGVRNLDRHLARLEASAAALDFVFERARIEVALGAQLAAAAGHALAPAPGAAQGRPPRARRRRARRAAARRAVTVLLAERPLDDPQGLGAHKTTLRARYDVFRAAPAAGAFDTLFFDSAGRLTEGARSNVFLLLDGEWRTPPAGRGGKLPGTMRAALLGGWC